MPTVLVVDDQERARALLRAELEEHDFSVVEAGDGEEGFTRFCETAPQVVVTDLAMPHCDGIELLRRIRSRSDVPVIVFSGHGSIQIAADAFKAGADDFVDSLDVEIDDLVARIRHAARSDRRAHPDPGAGGDAIADRIAGRSRAASRIRWQIAGLAPLTTPVLVTGEPGTGRSLAVRTLHETGATAAGSLRRIPAAAFVPADFADPGRVGAVQLVDVEGLSPDGQRYWARRLARDEQSSLRPALRVLATSAASLSVLAQQGRFDPALARILLRFEIQLPPLRERPEDVPDVARALLARIGRAVGRPRVQLSPAALEYLAGCRLGENASQLERLLERAVAYTLGRVIRKRTLQELMAELEHSVAGMREEHALRERERLLQTLQETGGNITHTAAILDKSRAAIYRLIAKHDIPLDRQA